jgi:general secretion pathway protein E
MLLVTGPTGSGKTTTLYAAISETQTGSDKIVTIEDPVEYQLQGVLQIPVNEKKGLTFARGLRSILRHDPDKIMVGEIRDSGDRADCDPIRAHGSPGVHHRSRQQRIRCGEPIHAHGRGRVQLRVGAQSGVLAQRLIRVVCEQCAESRAAAAAAARGIAAVRGGKRQLQLSRRAGLPALPRQRLPRAQGDRRIAGAER